MLRVPQLHPERTQRVPQHHPGHKPRERGCCAISERAGRPVFASSSPSFPLTPLFPLHTRRSPVSPIITTLAQKQGGRGYLMREFSAISDPRSAGETKADPSRKMIFAAELLCHSSSGDFNRLEDSVQGLELSTGHPAKDAHPERAARVAGFLRIFGTCRSVLATNSNRFYTFVPSEAQDAQKQGGWG